ncbi:hypothetical protein D3C77_292950 [compost metagenome]
MRERSGKAGHGVFCVNASLVRYKMALELEFQGLLLFTNNGVIRYDQSISR